MLLSRMTPCQEIRIKAPRWKQRVVGIASFRVGTHNKIIIEAKGKDGKPYYPEPLYASGETIKKHPIQHLPGSGVQLYLVPISELEPLELQ